MAVELEARERQLVRAERVAVIGQLTAGIAHEINNPIGVIRGYLKTMLPTVDPAASPELHEELEILDEEAAACQRIVDDLLSFAREPELELQPVPARRLLDDAVRRFGSTREGRDRRVELELVDDATLEVDPVRMQQVLANLLRNAADVSTDAIELRGRARPDGGYRIEVGDHGPGIAPDRHERVFEPFFSERRGGSGLGLAVSRGIVEAHAGRIFVDPRRRSGACIVVELPARVGGPKP
jgi:signal transduction histidine kinase